MCFYKISGTCIQTPILPNVRFLVGKNWNTGKSDGGFVINKLQYFKSLGLRCAHTLYRAQPV